MASAFFYGTLMHPKVLKRVLNNDANYLQICPAILTDHTRHKVKYADFPAIIPCERSKELLGRELTPEENCIRGTVVSGLTEEDMMLLDVFESDMYYRTHVRVHPLGPFVPVPTDVAATSEAVRDSLIPAAVPQLPSISELAEPIAVQTYVWRYENSQLEKDLWTFDEFVKKNAWKWIGDAGPTFDEYDEVDRERERLHERDCS